LRVQTKAAADSDPDAGPQALAVTETPEFSYPLQKENGSYVLLKSPYISSLVFTDC